MSLEQLNRRDLLLRLAALPPLVGAVSLVGLGTGSDRVTDELVWSYKSWLFFEHRMLSFELAGHDVGLSRLIEGQLRPGDDWHFRFSGGRGPAGWIDAPQPSRRAAIVLDAVGCLAMEAAR